MNKKIYLLLPIFLAIILFSAFAVSSDSFGKIIREMQDLFGKTYACYSPDGINIEKREKVVSNFGGSSGILLKDGAIILGGIDFSDRQGIRDEATKQNLKDVGFYKTSDNWHFSKMKIKIDGLHRTLTAWGDPTFIELPEGGYRMYFTERAGQNTPYFLVSAYSKDGYNYSFEDRITGASNVSLDAVDFTVLYEKRAQKYYIYTRAENQNEAYVLESKDGRYFDKRFKITIPFSLRFSIIDEGERYIAFGGHVLAENQPCSNLRYPAKAVSTDGLNWTRTAKQPSGPWTGNESYCHTTAVIKTADGFYFY